MPEQNLAAPELAAVDIQGVTRQSFILRGAVAAGAVYGLGAVSPFVREALAQGSDGDVEILNFALTLEYLEATFYERALKQTKGLGGDARKLAGTIHENEMEHVTALTGTIKDLGGKPVKAPKVGFGNAPSDLRRMAFARRDGSVDLVLWRAASLWDVGAKKDLSVPSVDLNVVAEKSTNASVVKISNGSGRTSLGKGSSFSVAIGGSPVIVRFAYMATGTTPTDPTPAGSTIRVDVGSARPVTSGGTSWVADTGFTGGTAGTARTAVPGTTSPEVYRNYRWGMKTYALPIANGTYTVRLLMAEDTWRTAGKRVFSVTAEGVPALSNVDIFSAVGKDKALIRTFRAKVTDGWLDLGFSASVDNAIISGIEIQASS